jgi:peptidyl-prolyl cis-trans isomerase A (cyclophilin A)
MLSFVLVLLFFSGKLPVDGPSSPSAPSSINVVLETELGNMTLEIDAARAPITAANFLKYVDAGLYDGGEFHRAVRPDNETRKDVPIQVIQARINQERLSEAFPPVALERTVLTGLKHVDGTLSMARDVTPTRTGPDTVRSDFFICIGDQPLLDYGGKRSPDGQGFSAFGRIIDGFDVARRIHMAPTPKDHPARFGVAEGQSLVPPIKIIRARRK